MQLKIKSNKTNWWLFPRSKRSSSICSGATNRPGYSKTSADVRNHDHSGHLLHGFYTGDHDKTVSKNVERENCGEEETNNEWKDTWEGENKYIVQTLSSKLHIIFKLIHSYTWLII